MTAPNTSLTTFMRVMKRTGFDETDILKLGFDYNNAHPVLQAFLRASLEQVEDVAKEIGIHADQLNGPLPRPLHKTVFDKMQLEKEEEGRPTHGNS